MLPRNQLAEQLATTEGREEEERGGLEEVVVGTEQRTLDLNARINHLQVH